MATICMIVFNLPPLLAGITPLLITQNLKKVTNNSLNKITQVIHQARRSSDDNPINATPIRALSAIGSKIFPKFVINLYFLAIMPSAMSVKPATIKTMAEIKRIKSVVAFSLNKSQARTGTNKILKNVKKLGRFKLLAVEMGSATRSGTAGLITFFSIFSSPLNQHRYCQQFLLLRYRLV